MNQANTNPLNYAGPATNSPGVAILSDGSNGVFHCRVTEMYNPGFWKNAGSGIYLLIFALIQISFILFLFIGIDGLKALIWLIFLGFPLLLTLMASWSQLSDAYHKKAPDFVDLIADSEGFTFKFSHGQIITAPGKEIRDFWIKQNNYILHANNKWRVYLLSHDNRLANYEIEAPTRSDPAPVEENIRKALNLVEKSRPRFIWKTWDIDPESLENQLRRPS